MAAFLVFSETNKILWFSHNKNIFRICKQKCMKTVCGCTHFFFVSPVNNGSNYEKNKEKIEQLHQIERSTLGFSR